MIHHITRATRHLIFWTLIAAAIGLTGVRLLLSEIERYKSNLAVNIGTVVGNPVTIGRLGAKMRGFNPELVLKDIAVASTGSEKPSIQFNEIRLGINLLDMLASRDLLASSWVTLVGAKLSIRRQRDGSVAIVGIKSGDGQPDWLLQGRKYEVLQSEITWLDEKTGNGRPLVFNQVDLALSNLGEHHRLNVLMKLPQKIGDTLRVSMDFSGNVFEPSTIQGRAYIEGQSLLLPELAVLAQTSVGERIHIDNGTGTFKIWGDWRQSELVSMDVDAQIQQLALARKDKRELFAKQLKTRLHWALIGAGKQWQLDVNDFSLGNQDNPQSAVKKWTDAIFSVSGQRMDDNALHKLALYVERLDLQQASKLAQFFMPLPDKQANLLAQAQVQGMLGRFSLFADLDMKSLALNGSFANIGIAPLLSVPGIENLTGQIKGNEKQGTITLQTKEGRLTAPELFREVLPIDRLQGLLNWRQDENVWSISGTAIDLDSLSFQSKTKFRVDIPKTAKPVFMDLQSSFAGDATQVSHFYPVGIMDKDVVSWLDHAFIRGNIANGGLLVYGNLSDFPFNTAPGVFEAVFSGEQFELSYAPEWPHISGMNAEVMFSQEGLKVNVLQGQSGIAREDARLPAAAAAKVAIKQAEVTIPDLNNSKHVLIKGEAEGGIDQVLAFMQQTPLSSPVDSLLEAIAPQGHTQVTLDLKIPLIDGAPTKVDGMARLKDAKLTVKSLDLPVSKISGDLKFNEQGIFSDTIQAAALNHPIQINIGSSVDETVVNVEGSVGVDDLQRQFAMPWWKIAAGAADYRLKLALPYDNVAPELLVESTLFGVSLDLPPSLAKTKEQIMPLSLTFNLNDEQLLPVLLNYDNKVKAAMQLDTVKKNLYSGSFLVGTGEVAQSQAAGVKLEINRDRLALQDWLGLATVQGAGDNVIALKIHSDHALWNKTDIGAFGLDLKRSSNFWEGAIASSFAKGSVKIPSDFQSTGRISLNMDSLDISALKQIQSKDAADSQVLSAETTPLLTITSNKTLWQSIDLGRLSLATERIPGGMRFRNVELTGEKQKLVASGDWQTRGGHSITHAQGHLEVPLAGQMLSNLGITKDLSETSAAADFSVDWNAAPYQFSLASLKGQVDINLKNGRILSIEPGFGRLLGVLALAQWVKRAQLDFSDVYEEGLTFNSIKGHFDLANGVASTHNLVVDAVPAKIVISGDTDLVNQTVDHIINVTPKSADAVPIAGTIMGKVAALVGRSLTGKDQEGFFFGSQYLVKGAWGEAEIIPMHKNDGLFQKTWNGITDFPWLNPQEEK